MALALRPPLLDDMQVEEALASLVNDFAKGSKIKYAFKREGSLRALDADRKTCLYRILQEALTNAAKHGRPTGVEVLLGTDGERVWLEIQDDGKGFDVGKRSGKGMGLVSMRERARQCGGVLDIRSAAGKGSRVRVELPLAGEPRNEERHD